MSKEIAFDDKENKTITIRGFGSKTSVEDQSFREIERKILFFSVYLFRTRLVMTEVRFTGLSV